MAAVERKRACKRNECNEDITRAAQAKYCSEGCRLLMKTKRKQEKEGPKEKEEEEKGPPTKRRHCYRDPNNPLAPLIVSEATLYDRFMQEDPEHPPPTPAAIQAAADDMQEKGFVVLKQWLSEQHVEAMLAVAHHQHEPTMGDSIDAGQQDVGWDLPEQLRLKPDLPDKTWLFRYQALDQVAGPGKRAALRALHDKLACVVARILGCAEAEVGEIENFSSLSMSLPKHRAQQWHIDSRDPRRLLVFVGFEDNTRHVQFFSNHFPHATRNAFGGARAGVPYMEGGPELSSDTKDNWQFENPRHVEYMKPYAKAMAARREEAEQDVQGVFHAGDVILALATVLHRAPAVAAQRKVTQLHKWHRVVGFGTVAARGVPPYLTIDQPMGSVCVANVFGVDSPEWIAEMVHLHHKEKNADAGAPYEIDEKLLGQIISANPDDAKTNKGLQNRLSQHFKNQAKKARSRKERIDRTWIDETRTWIDETLVECEGELNPELVRQLERAFVEKMKYG